MIVNSKDRRIYQVNSTEQQAIDVRKTADVYNDRIWYRDRRICLVINSTEQEAIDVRRKADVLLHKQNAKPLTKKERFAYLAKRPNQPHSPYAKLLCAK